MRLVETPRSWQRQIKHRLSAGKDNDKHVRSLNSGTSIITLAHSNNYSAMWAKSLLRQSTNVIFRRSVFRFSVAGQGEGPQPGAKWDKGAQGGEYREHESSENRNIGGSGEKMSFQEQKMQAAPKYDKWNEGLDSVSQKMREDKGSVRWSRDASEAKTDLETDNNAVAGRVDGAKANKWSALAQEKQVETELGGFDIHSAGRINEDSQKDVDIHAAGRFDEHVEGTRDRKTTDISGAKNQKPDTSRMPGSGLGSTRYTARVDSQWTQVSNDKKSPKTAEMGKRDNKGRDQHSTLTRWANNNPASTKFQTSDNLSSGVSKQKK